MREAHGGSSGGAELGFLVGIVLNGRLGVQRTIVVRSMAALIAARLMAALLVWNTSLEITIVL